MHSSVAATEPLDYASKDASSYQFSTGIVSIWYLGWPIVWAQVGQASDRVRAAISWQGPPSREVFGCRRPGVGTVLFQTRVSKQLRPTKQHVDSSHVTAQNSATAAHRT